MGKSRGKAGPLLHKVIRIAYVLVILVLGVFAFRTWQQLQSLRSEPVALPNFWLHVTGEPGRLRIQANGTWRATGAVAAPTVPASGKFDRLQTSSFECIQARMLCLESTAVVEVMQRPFLESIPRAYEIESWTEQSVITRPAVLDKCRMQAIGINLAEKTVTAEISLLPDKTAADCKDATGKVNLEDGSKLLTQVGKS